MDRHIPSILRLFVLLVVTTVFLSPVLQGGFTHIDDNAYVYQNERVRDGLSFENLVWALQSLEVSNWHPLTWLSYMLDVELFGVAAGPMHGVNLLFHLANSLLLFALLRRFFSLDAAFLGSLVFALHPLHVESVAWISQRKEVMSFFFLMLATHAYVTYKIKAQTSYYVGSILAFIAALMAKPMAVSFPVLLILLDCWPLNCWPNLKRFSELKRYAFEKLPFVIFSAIACALALLSHDFAIDVAANYSLSERVVITTLGYIEYLKQFILPLNLAFYYPMPELGFNLYFWLCSILLLAVSVATIVYIRRFPFLFTAWWWYVVSLLPVIGLVKVGGQFVADRYTYLPLTGIIFALAYLVQRLSSKPDFRGFYYGAVGFLILVYGLLSYDYASSWRNDISAAQRAIRVTPDNPIAYVALVRGIEAQVIQDALNLLGPQSDCINGSIDVFAGVGSEVLQCLESAGVNEAASRLILVAHYLRNFELEQADNVLQSLTVSSDSAYIVPYTYLFAVRQATDTAGQDLSISINAALTLPPHVTRSLVLFLGFYQIGDIDRANVYLNEGLRSLTAQT